LSEGTNNFGSSDTNPIVLPVNKCAPINGSVILESSGGLRLVYSSSKEAKEYPLYVDGKSVDDHGVVIVSDEKQSPTLINIGKDAILSFTVIKRAEKIGVRAKDKQADSFIHFKGIDSFPISLKWRIKAKYVPHEKPKALQITNVMGLSDPQQSSGYLTFDVDGKSYSLDAIDEDDESEWWIIFKDLTNGKETYGMRYLYVPRGDGKNTYIDFNKCYNPPCAFTPYATCPVPPQQNRLKLRVEAGEKKIFG